MMRRWSGASVTENKGFRQISGRQNLAVLSVSEKQRRDDRIWDKPALHESGSERLTTDEAAVRKATNRN
jgi:hypothetical protein